MNVKTILAAKGSDVVTIGPFATLSSAAELLAKHRIGAVVVVENERPVGILSERDIVRALAEHGKEALGYSVRTVMTSDVKTCTEDDTVSGLMERMTSGKYRHLPVLTNGRLAGLISIGDVVKQRVEEIEREGEVMRDYIRTA